ncbi:urease accessory protein UreD [Limosilactobacillus equigenerosi]|uniref:urease accessory protein UreD n=1 Tax=Limosilactobacillus equigenerosi TaxID=417373 RepID=UPI000B2A4F8C|nr:urease accessory protein UreD [Limosilactobacillus equigenerosi]
MSTQYNGVIDIRFAYQNNRTLATKTYHQGNSRISSNIMANGDLPYYFLISTGGGFVEGERYLQTVQLDTKAHAILTTQTPNYIYKCEHGHVTKQTNELTVKKDAFLEYYIDETIPYKDAQFAQSTTVNMEKGAKLILTDGLTRGWSPDDQPFQFGQVSQKVTIKYDHELVYNDFFNC